MARGRVPPLNDKVEGATVLLEPPLQPDNTTAHMTSNSVRSVYYNPDSLKPLCRIPTTVLS
jgi:hypothetical protein